MEIVHKKIWRLYTTNGDTYVGAMTAIEAMAIFNQSKSKDDFKDDIKKHNNFIYFNPEDIDEKNVHSYPVFTVNDGFFVIAESVEQAGEYWLYDQQINRDMKSMDYSEINHINHFDEILMDRILPSITKIE